MVVAALETVGGGERWGGAPFALLYDMNRLLGVPPPPTSCRLCDKLESEGRRCGCKAELGERLHNGLSLYNPRLTFLLRISFPSSQPACVFKRCSAQC